METLSSTQDMTLNFPSCRQTTKNAFLREQLNRTALNNHTLTGRDRLLLFWVAILSSAVSSLGQILSHWWDNPSFCHPATHKKRKKALKCFGGGAKMCLPFQFSHPASWRIPADSLRSGCSCGDRRYRRITALEFTHLNRTKYSAKTKRNGKSRPKRFRCFYTI